jgi:hypothetical protein
MGEDTPAFLTEKRRAVLNDNYEGEPSTHRAHKTNIRQRSQTALEELTEVAESQTIVNHSTFDPDDVFRFLRALLNPDYYVNPAHEDPHPEEFEQYRDRLHVQLDKLLRERHRADEDR